MGGNSSKDNYDYNLKEQEDLRMKALINYDRRLKSYNNLYHGCFIDYVEWCRKKYELECIPERCHKGLIYKAKYDNYLI